jgi:hypothetical protein
VANRSRDCGDLDGFERFDAEAAAFASVQTGSAARLRMRAHPGSSAQT